MNCAATVAQLCVGRLEPPAADSTLLYPGMQPDAIVASGLSTVLQSAAASTQTCAQLGCVRAHGWLVCQFHPRAGKDDARQRTDVTSGKCDFTVPEWKLRCDGVRRCNWRINYMYSKKHGEYKLIAKDVQHTGHTLLVHAGVRLQTTSDVTELMWTSLCGWVKMQIGGQTLREASPHYHIF